MDITINHISIRGKSSLNISSDTCAICRENVCEGCIKCQQANENSQNKNFKTCFSVVGVCGHTYHYDCIENCISTQYGGKKCPLCNKGWEMKKRTSQISDNKYKNIFKKQKYNNDNNNVNGENNQHQNNNNLIVVSDDEEEDD
jgi:hypothetical protein